MYLYVLCGLRGYLGVLRAQNRKYSHAIAFNLCALKFCNHARTRSARQTPGQARPVFHRRSMSEDQDTQTGAAVYLEFLQYASDPQKISANDQHEPGQAPE